MRRSAGAAALAGLLLAVPASAAPELPSRVRRIVLHVLGGPSYAVPERRFVFATPERTQARWSRRFGAHWIIWTDGSLWPRHPAPGEPRAFLPPEGPLNDEWRQRLAAQAAPVYGHLYNGNSRALGIEVAHSGRSRDPFPAAQIRSLAWLVRSLLTLSDGRLTIADVWGHKDLDQRPAYVRERCIRPGCPVFVDQSGRPYRRRVDPPESLFAALAREGLVIPRGGREDDHELHRAEALASGQRPRIAQ